MLGLVGPLVRRLGEPLRSAFTGDEMRALLGRYAFEVVRDEALPGIAAQLSGDLGVSTRALKHMRIATADRRSPVGRRLKYKNGAADERRRK